MGHWRKWLAGASVLALCLGTAAFGGLRFAREDLTTAAASAGQELSEVERFRQLRERMRAVGKAQLSDVAHSPDADPELASMAKRQLVELCLREEQELTIEGVLALRGWDDPVVTVHRDAVNVLLKADGAQGSVISAAESAAILELVCRETGVQSGNVKIMPME